jgi:cation transport ATPase
MAVPTRQQAPGDGEMGMGLSIAAMVFASFGFIPPAAGAILQEGVDVLVILNALRAGRL